MRTVTVTCEMCHKPQEITAPESEYKAWESGVLIQRALRSLNDDQRELLISQTCGKCFDELFQEVDDE